MKYLLFLMAAFISSEVIASPGMYQLTKIAGGSSVIPREFGVPQTWTELQLSTNSHVTIELQLYESGGRYRISATPGQERFGDWEEIISWRILRNGYLAYDTAGDPGNRFSSDRTTLLSELPGEVGRDVFAINASVPTAELERMVNFFGEKGMRAYSSSGLINFNIYSVARLE